LDPKDLQLIDSVNVNLHGFQYLDSGQITGTPLNEKTLYCYYVVTQGSYGNPAITEPLINYSQIVCGQPNDTVPPCGIQNSSIQINESVDCASFVSDKPCNFDDYFHQLNWNRSTGDSCDVDIRHYEIWFSENGLDDDFRLLATVGDTTYRHTGLSSFAGCYKIRVVDRSGNTSSFSDKVCYENCPRYELPNIFTPNNDGYNDIFHAFTFPYDKCPRFVKSVDFKVYDRWGTEVFSTNSEGEHSIYINWDGRTMDGKTVGSGVYYYIADVEYDNVLGSLRNQQLKGWIQVLR
jgi:gliding motility-associated-like protein